jgi:uncharacterized repeat protein (TIGR01451 family)
LTAVGAALGVISGTLALALSSAPASALPPFECTVSSIYVAQGNAATQLNVVEYGADESTFSPIGAPTVPTYNAIGYGLDENIYAMNALNHLVQVDSNGVATDLGLIAPIADVGNIMNAGAVDPATGLYWVMSSGADEIFSIDLGTLAVTTYDLTQSTGLADFTFIGNSIYGQRVNTTQLVRIRPDLPFVNRLAFIEAPGLPAGVGAGAAWTYGNGNLGLQDNVTGNIYQYEISDPSGINAAAALIAVSPGEASTGNNDGTSCVGSSSDLSITKDAPETYQPGTPIAWTITVTNNGPSTSSGYVVTDSVPAAVTNVASGTPGCVVVGNEVTCTGGELANGESDEIVITGIAPAPGGGAVGNTVEVLGNDSDDDLTDNTATSSSAEGGVNGLCRAIPLGLLNQNLAVANPAQTPCALDAKSILNLFVPLGPTLPPLLAPLAAGVRATAILGLTSEGPGRAAAAAMVARATITIPALGLNLNVEGVSTTATSHLTSCDAPAALGSSSRVAKITLNGTTIPGEAASISIPLIVGALHLNQKIVSGNTIIRRAVFLDLPGTALDVVIAESKAGAECPAPPPPAP